MTHPSGTGTDAATAAPEAAATQGRKTGWASKTTDQPRRASARRTGNKIADAELPGPPSSDRPRSKLAILIDLLTRPAGASLEEMMAVTAWQAHSVRGAMAGAIRKRGHAVTSAKEDGVRRYRIESAT